MATTRYVIVGGGLAAATAAEELLERDADGDIHLFAGEPHNPYIRPLLSKELMLGKDSRDSVFVHPLTGRVKVERGATRLPMLLGPDQVGEREDKLF